jgi:predicted DNA-binding transcriptional regulator YafY
MAKKNKHIPSSKPDAERRLRQADRLARIMRVLQLLQSRGRWNAKTIAEELEVVERTVHRDLQALEFAGVPWYYDQSQQCYRVRPDYKFAVPSLTDDEALGQVLATALTKADGLNIGDGAAPTTRKIAASSHEEVSQLMADAENLVSVMDLKLADHSQHREIIKTIQLALVQKKQAAGKYESPYQDEAIGLSLHPIRLCLVKSAWYLIARSTDSDEIKSYRVARFKTLRMLDSDADVPRNFDLKNFFGNAWSVFRGDQSYDIEIKFNPEVAKIATETIWHHTQEKKFHPDGSVTLSFKVDGLEEICNWLMSWAQSARVEKPAELRDFLVTKLEAALENQK